MALTTPLSIITLALRDAGVIGVGQTPSAEDANDAFDKLNMILSQWNHQRWLIFHLVDVSCVSTGAEFYTVGDGEDFDTPRPDRLEAAFLRQYPTQQQPVDQFLRILEAREDYNRITVKLTTGPAMYAFYDSAFPVGKVYFWPLSQASIYSHFITVKAQLAEFTSLSETINLPPVYKPAMLYSLACWLRPGYQLSADPQIIAMAKNSLSVIRGANAQIPRLRMPAAVRGWGNRYDIWSDQMTGSG